MTVAIQDQRTRIGVFLYKSERGTSKFWCPRCKNFIAELVNQEVRALTDVVGDNASGISVRCSGTVEPGRKCHAWMTFYLGEAK